MVSITKKLYSLKCLSEIKNDNSTVDSNITESTELIR